MKTNRAVNNIGHIQELICIMELNVNDKSHFDGSVREDVLRAIDKLKLDECCVDNLTTRS